MPSYLSEDRSAIRERLRNEFNRTDGEGDALFPDQDVPGSPGYTLREIMIRLMETQHEQINTMIDSVSPLTASGSDLDRWGRFFDIQRSQSQSPRGRVLLQSDVTGAALERLAGSRQMAAGTRLSNGTVELETTERVAIPESGTEAEVQVQSLIAQEGTALRQGTQLNIPNRENITGEALTDISGGRSSETDDQYRFRLSRALRAPSTFEGLRARMLGNESVDTVQIDEGKYGPGTVEVYVNPAVGFADNQLREQLESLATEGPSRVYVIFPSYEGLTMQVEVDGPTPADAKTAIVDYVNNIPGGDRLNINDIEQRVREQGARDARVIAMRRGSVSDDRKLINARRLQQITNLQAPDDRTQWYTRRDWITLCN